MAMIIIFFLPLLSLCPIKQKVCSYDATRLAPMTRPKIQHALHAIDYHFSSLSILFFPFYFLGVVNHVKRKKKNYQMEFMGERDNGGDSRRMMYYSKFKQSRLGLIFSSSGTAITLMNAGQTDQCLVQNCCSLN